MNQNAAQNKNGTSGRAAGLALREADAVLFDLDGTLVDSMWMWKEIDIEYLGRFGYTCPPGSSEDHRGHELFGDGRIF